MSPIKPPRPATSNWAGAFWGANRKGGAGVVPGARLAAYLPVQASSSSSFGTMMFSTNTTRKETTSELPKMFCSSGGTN